ncbi:MAG: GNAT family N-acetyltransferase [Tannerella sp.]|jgi:GNAT superfamily N-acetyltransferase|nr:GNAT family N-acetyltransferase [Tannerella sp.]
MNFRNATGGDLSAMKEIVRQAQASLKARGVDQWQNGYPSDEVILRDIARQQAYVATADGRVIAMATVVFDDEPTYDRITDGRWLSTGAFAVVHRMAVDDRFRQCGVASFIFGQVEAMCRHNGTRSFKVDTHRDNLPMRRFLEKHGFTRCGIIFLHDGNERIAYEKLLDDDNR